MATKRADSGMKCIEIMRHPKVKVHDRGTGKSAVLLNGQRERVRRIRMDGCLSPIGELSADFLVSLHRKVDVIVELKGSNVDHAVLQVEATRRFWESHAENVQRQLVSAWILCSEYPAGSTKVSGYRNAFRKRGAILVISTHNGEERAISEFLPKRP